MLVRLYKDLKRQIYNLPIIILNVESVVESNAQIGERSCPHKGRITISWLEFNPVINTSYRYYKGSVRRVINQIFWQCILETCVALNGVLHCYVIQVKL